MLGILGRRAIDLAVFFMALYAFAFVPLGRRTGLEHLQAILATHAARSALHEAGEATTRLRRTLVDAFVEAEATPAPEGEAREPARSREAHPVRGRPVVPRLPRAPVNAVTAPLLDGPDASL